METVLLAGTSHKATAKAKHLALNAKSKSKYFITVLKHRSRPSTTITAWWPYMARVYTVSLFIRPVLLSLAIPRGYLQCNRRMAICSYMYGKPEASFHWGTWGTCPPPDGVATLVNSLQNRVKSITLCVTLNADNGKIVLVTLCIQIEWLFDMLSGVKL